MLCTLLQSSSDSSDEELGVITFYNYAYVKYTYSMSVMLQQKEQCTKQWWQV